jgi:hypothetical protein
MTFLIDWPSPMPVVNTSNEAEIVVSTEEEVENHQFGIELFDRGDGGEGRIRFSAYLQVGFPREQTP